MKRIFMILLICIILISPVKIFANKVNSIGKEENTRYVEMEVPIYAVCQGNMHKDIFGTAQFDGTIVSTSGRTVWRGDTPIYVYVYYDQYANYYEPYFDGYTYTTDGTYVSGCPLW